MRRLALALALSLALIVGCVKTWNPYVSYADQIRPQARAVPTVLTVTPKVIDDMDLLFFRFGQDDLTGETRGEFIVCLEGEVRGDTLVVDDFRMPHMTRSTRTSAGMKPGSCSQYPRLLGTLHSHPLGDKGEQHCTLSKRDVFTWLIHNSEQYEFLLCDNRLLAWWDRSQVDMTAFHGPEAVEKVDPPKGQFILFRVTMKIPFDPDERFRAPADCPAGGWGLGVIGGDGGLHLIAHGPRNAYIEKGFIFAHPDGSSYRFDLIPGYLGGRYIELALSRYVESPDYDGFWTILESHRLRRHPFKCAFLSKVLPSGDQLYFGAVEQLQRHQHPQVTGYPRESSERAPSTPGDPSVGADMRR